MGAHHINNAPGSAVIQRRAFWGSLPRGCSLAPLLPLLTLSPALRDQITFTQGEVLLSTGHHISRPTPRLKGNLTSVRTGGLFGTFLGN